MILVRYKRVKLYAKRTLVSFAKPIMKGMPVRALANYLVNIPVRCITKFVKRVVRCIAKRVPRNPVLQLVNLARRIAKQILAKCVSFAPKSGVKRPRKIA